MKKWLLFLFVLSYVACKDGTQKVVHDGKVVNAVVREKKEWDRHVTFIDSIEILPPQISKFVPEGYLPLDTAKGDLNLDGINDVLVVIRKKDEDSLTFFIDSVEQKRPLMILIGQTDGTYILEKRNDDVVMCIACSGIVRSDPFTGLVVKNGCFSVEHGVAEGPQHWETITTFKYDKEKKEWYLFKDGTVSYKMNDSQDMDAEVMVKDYENIKTKKDFGIIPFEKYHLGRNPPSD